MHHIKPQMSVCTHFSQYPLTKNLDAIGGYSCKLTYCKIIIRSRGFYFFWEVVSAASKRGRPLFKGGFYKNLPQKICKQSPTTRFFQLNMAVLVQNQLKIVPKHMHYQQNGRFGNKLAQNTHVFLSKAVLNQSRCGFYLRAASISTKFP